MVNQIINYLKEDNNRRTFIFTVASILINLAFAAYNGMVGLVFESIWHKSIFGYYLFLTCVKTLLVVGEKSKSKKNCKFILYCSFVVLLFITLAMVAPSILLVQGKREYDWGLIPAIATATYTTYSITMSIINFNKAKTNDNVMVKQIRLVNLNSALMSVLVLQNTLISANGGYEEKMKLLSMYTSIGIIAVIVIIEVYSFVVSIKKEK